MLFHLDELRAALEQRRLSPLTPTQDPINFWSGFVQTRVLPGPPIVERYLQSLDPALVPALAEYMRIEPLFLGIEEDVYYGNAGLLVTVRSHSTYRPDMTKGYAWPPHTLLDTRTFVWLCVPDADEYLRAALARVSPAA